MKIVVTAKYSAPGEGVHVAMQPAIERSCAYPDRSYDSFNHLAKKLVSCLAALYAIRLAEKDASDRIAFFC